MNRSDEVVQRVARLAAMEQEVRSARETSARIETVLTRLEEKVDRLQAERVTRQEFEKSEARLRLVELAVAGGALYGGWTGFGQ